MKQPDTTLTKADTVALWHAVDSYALQVQVMPSMTMPDGSTFSTDQIEAERERLKAAKRALRKVNAIRKGQDGQSDPLPQVLALIDREIEDARQFGVRFKDSSTFRESAERRLSVLEELRPKVLALQQGAGDVKNCRSTEKLQVEQETAGGAGA